MKKQNQQIDFWFLAVVLILVLVMIYSGLRILESTVLRPSTGVETGFVSKTITRDGVDYFPKQDITTVLVLGIDEYGPVKDSGSYLNSGAADMNVLLIFDETNQVCDVLHLNRDTMLEMPVLGLNGKQAGTYFGQLALAHTYGSGLEDSCENSCKAVSELLYGLQIDYYVALNMDAIAILNDAVGGVEVFVTEDFSDVDPTIGMGKVKLMGQQALNYVQTRKGVGDQLNLSRIERHKAYMKGFVEAYRSMQEVEAEFILDAYEAVSPYLVTDCSASAVNGMVERYQHFEIGQVFGIEGENVMGEEYFEFYVDEEKLDKMIIELFYVPKK